MSTVSKLAPPLLDNAPLRRTTIWVHHMGDLLNVSFLLAVALPYRLINIETAAPKSDEGIRLAQLYLMSVGYRPVRDIFASQGPLSLDATYPLFAIFGGTLAGARLAVVVYSLALIVATYLVARLVGGRLAGLLAGLLLVLSPVYLENSRTALVEVPALLPATLAVAAAFQFQHSGSRLWLAAASLLAAVAVLVKPIVLAVGLPVLLALASRRERCRSNLTLASLLGVLLVLAVVVLYGPAEIYEQVLRYRAGSAQAEGWSLEENLRVLQGELRWESTAWLGLVLAAAPLTLLSTGRRALPLVIWAWGSLTLLLAYSPLMEKHAVVLVVPLAVLAGTASGSALERLAVLLKAGFFRSARYPGEVGDGRIAVLLGSLALVLVAWYLTSVPALVARGYQLSQAGTAGRDETQFDDAALLQALTGPDGFIIVDEPILSYLARRRVPPSLADPTEFRIKSRTLTGDELIETASQFDIQVMLLWSDGLRDIKEFGDWVDAHYWPARIYERRNGKDRAFYLRNDIDLPAARRLLEDGLSPIQANFGGLLTLTAASLEPTEVRAGRSLTVTAEVEALVEPGVDYRLLAIVTDQDGKTVKQVERSLGGGGVGTSAWQPGRWTIRSFSLLIPSRTPPGQYSVSLALYDSKAERMLPLTVPIDGNLAEQVPIGTLSVR